MAATNALTLVIQLAKQIHAYYSVGFDSWKGTSNKEKLMLDLGKSASRLVDSIGSEQMRDVVAEDFNRLVSDVEAAGFIGLLSTNELQNIHKLLDELWKTIEKEYT